MVKRRKTTVPAPPASCRLHDCLSLLAGAWTADVIWFLREGERCFTELQYDLRGVSAKMLTARLRMLEQRGVVTRSTKETSPPTVWYGLTAGGRELAGALDQVVDIAHRLKEHGADAR